MGCGSSSNTENTQDNTPSSNPTEKAPSSANENSEKKQTTSTVPTSSDTGNKSTGNKFAQDGVVSHNQFREKHSAPPMTVADDLTEYSQKYADKIAKLDKMEHSNCTLPSGGSVGENLYCFWSSDTSAMPTAKDAVKAWYDEIKDYDFSKGGFSMATGHFTQVVWKESIELGMGWAKSASGTTYVVANYRPAGNMMGDFDNNVTQS